MKWFWQNSDLSRTAKVFLVLIVLEAILLVGISVFQMFSRENSLNNQFGGILIFNSILIVFFGIDAVLNENIFLLFCFIGVTLFMCGYVVFQFIDQFYNKDSNLTPTHVYLMWIRFVSSCLFTPVNVGLAFSVYRSFGWKIFRKIGALPEMIQFYRTYQIAVSLLKFDLQFGVNLVTLAGFFLFSGYELIIDISAFVITIIWAILGWISLRHELRAGMFVFWLLAFVQPAYIIYNIVDYQIDGISADSNFVPVIYFVMGLSLICRAMVLIWTIICYRNFGNGLKEVFTKEEEHVEKSPLINQFG